MVAVVPSARRLIGPCSHEGADPRPARQQPSDVPGAVVWSRGDVTRRLPRATFLCRGWRSAIAAIADTFDGRFARSFARSERQARLGRELDSLVDAATFGVVPLIIVATRFEPDGIAASHRGSPADSTCLPLSPGSAFYNVEEDEIRFIGIPTPAAALLCVTSLVITAHPWLAAWPLVVGGLLMIAPIALPRPRGVGLLAFASWGVALVAMLAFRLAA